jgi:predicted secreted protein with PEFG-CTERM motif
MDYKAYILMLILLASSALVVVNTVGIAFSQASGGNKFNVTIDGKTYPINYQISGGKLNSIKAQKDNSTLLLDISSATSDGKLAIELPRNIIDSKNPQNTDEDYVVFADGQDTPADETTNNAQVRTLAIDFDQGTEEIEIAGTRIVPEFGGSAISVIVLAVGILGIILVSAKYKKFSFMPRQ